MRFTEIFLYTRDLVSSRQFYSRQLGLPIIQETDNNFSLQAGWTTIHFEQKADFPIYHFAFNIPENQRFEALKWLKERTEIIHNGEEEIVDFQNWNAHAIYFKDPVGNILEFIARHDLANASDAPFSSKSILCLSEIGLVTPEPVQMMEKLQAQLGISPYRQTSPRFAAMGDEEALFIVVPNDRNWFPTEIPSEVAAFRILGEHQGRSINFIYG